MGDMDLRSWKVSLLNTSFMFLSFNAALIAEIIKKFLDLNLLLKSANHEKSKRSSNLAMLSIFSLLLLCLCNLFAYGHYIYIGKIPEPTPKLTFLYTFMFYHFCEGFVAPMIVIFVVEHLRTYFLTHLSGFGMKLKDFYGEAYFQSNVIMKFKDLKAHFSGLALKWKEVWSSLCGIYRHTKVEPMIETI
jgi:hypothetical protein